MEIAAIEMRAEKTCISNVKLNSMRVLETNRNSKASRANGTKWDSEDYVYVCIINHMYRGEDNEKRKKAQFRSCFNGRRRYGIRDGNGVGW